MTRPVCRARRIWPTLGLRLAGHTGVVLSLAITPNGQILASGGQDQTVRLWEVPNGRELARWQAHAGGVTALAFDPHGETLASAGADGTLRLWNIPFIRSELAALDLAW
jgi:WD40 repeat protein